MKFFHDGHDYEAYLRRGPYTHLYSTAGLTGYDPDVTDRISLVVMKRFFLFKHQFEGNHPHTRAHFTLRCASHFKPARVGSNWLVVFVASPSK